MDRPSTGRRGAAPHQWARVPRDRRCRRWFAAPPRRWRRLGVGFSTPACPSGCHRRCSGAAAARNSIGRRRRRPRRRSSGRPRRTARRGANSSGRGSGIGGKRPGRGRPACRRSSPPRSARTLRGVGAGHRGHTLGRLQPGSVAAAPAGNPCTGDRRRRCPWRRAQRGGAPRLLGSPSARSRGRPGAGSARRAAGCGPAPSRRLGRRGGGRPPR